MDLNLLTVRRINSNDYFKNYLDLLEQLTIVNKNNISFDVFCKFVETLNDNHLIFVIEHENKIIATTTLLIENKLIRQMGKVAHVEDVVVDKNFNGKNIGKHILTFVCEYAKNIGCYKIILDCDENVTKFYKKCEFVVKGNFMAKYF